MEYTYNVGCSAHKCTIHPVRHSKQLGELTAQHEEDLSRVQEQLRRERDRAAADREHFESEIDAVGRIIKVLLNFRSSSDLEILIYYE